jgi:hypothetical protein
LRVPIDLNEAKKEWRRLGLQKVLQASTNAEKSQVTAFKRPQ